MGRPHTCRTATSPGRPNSFNESQTSDKYRVVIAPGKALKYQLVLQLPASSIKDYDAMIELEEAILRHLGNIGIVDGHDGGASEMNIFILTDNPDLGFERVKQVIGTKDFMPQLKVAYREIGKDEFTILHPEGLSHFAIA